MQARVTTENNVNRTWLSVLSLRLKTIFKLGLLCAAMALSFAGSGVHAMENVPDWYPDIIGDAGEALGGDSADERVDSGPALEEIPLTRIVPGSAGNDIAADQLAAARLPGAGSRYTIQAGDRLSISVWREPELERDVEVSPDGWLAFPLIGEVPVTGLTIEEARLEIARRMERFIPDAVVTVSIREIRGNMVYVIGKVNRPGAISFVSHIDVVQALSQAGGTSPFADDDKIKVIRRTGEKQEAFSVNYAKIARGEALQQNILLRSGDIVLVP